MSSDQDEKVDGAQIAAQILGSMDPRRRDRLVQLISEKSPIVAERIEGKLYRFEDLLELTAKSLQTLLHEVDQYDLTLALKTASKELGGAILGALSERRRIIVEEEFRLLPPTRVGEVEAAQKRILIVLEDLRKQGRAMSRSESNLYV